MSTRRLTTTSNDRSVKSRCARRRGGNSLSPAARPRACAPSSSICSEASTPVTRAPPRASSSAARPVPVPTSSTDPIVDAADHVRQHPGLLAGDQLADRAAEPALVERPRHRGVGVNRRSCSGRGDSVTRGPWPRRPAPAASRAPRRPAASAPGTRRSCTSFPPGAGPRRRPPPLGPDRSGPPGCRPRIPAVDAPVSIGRVVVEHLRVRQEPRRDDRFARAQVLVDLERRVGSARPR